MPFKNKEEIKQQFGKLLKQLREYTYNRGANNAASLLPVNDDLGHYCYHAIRAFLGEMSYTQRYNPILGEEELNIQATPNSLMEYIFASLKQNQKQLMQFYNETAEIFDIVLTQLYKIVLNLQENSEPPFSAKAKKLFLQLAKEIEYIFSSYKLSLETLRDLKELETKKANLIEVVDFITEEFEPIFTPPGETQASSTTNNDDETEAAKQGWAVALRHQVFKSYLDNRFSISTRGWYSLNAHLSYWINTRKQATKMSDAKQEQEDFTEILTRENRFLETLYENEFQHFIFSLRQLAIDIINSVEQKPAIEQINQLLTTLALSEKIGAIEIILSNFQELLQLTYLSLSPILEISPHFTLKENFTNEVKLILKEFKDAKGLVAILEKLKEILLIPTHNTNLVAAKIKKLADDKNLSECLKNNDQNFLKVMATAVENILKIATKEIEAKTKAIKVRFNPYEKPGAFFKKSSPARKLFTEMAPPDKPTTYNEIVTAVTNLNQDFEKIIVFFESQIQQLDEHFAASVKSLSDFDMTQLSNLWKQANDILTGLEQLIKEATSINEKISPSYNINLLKLKQISQTILSHSNTLIKFIGQCKTINTALENDDKAAIESLANQIEQTVMQAKLDGKSEIIATDNTKDNDEIDAIKKLLQTFNEKVTYYLKAPLVNTM